MDGSRFDRLTRALAAPRTRRSAARLLGGAAALAVGAAPLAAKPKKPKKPCKAPKRKCGGKCIAVVSDDHNCGACGHTCARSEFCQNKTCTPRYQQDAHWPGVEGTWDVFVESSNTVFIVENYQDCVRQFSASGSLEYTYGVCGQWGKDNNHFQGPAKRGCH